MDVATDTLLHLNAEELRGMVQSLRQTVTFKQATIDKLTHENALLKRLKFAAQSERFGAAQRSLLEETLDEDLQAVSEEMAQLSAAPIPVRVKDQPKRQPLPAHLPPRCYGAGLYFSRPRSLAPARSPLEANHPRFISRANRTGFLVQCESSVWGAMSSMFTIEPSSPMYATESAINVFFIHMHWIPASSKMNNMPSFAPRDGRCMRPCIRVTKLSATSARIR